VVQKLGAGQSILLHDFWRKGVFLEKCHKWVGQAGINNKMLLEILIPLPPLPIQQEIVAKIEEEQKIVNANKRLIEIYEQKIKDTIGEVWGG
jgi:restriction endonuclease S subunit